MHFYLDKPNNKFDNLPAKVRKKFETTKRWARLFSIKLLKNLFS